MGMGVEGARLRRFPAADLAHPAAARILAAVHGALGCLDHHRRQRADDELCVLEQRRVVVELRQAAGPVGPVAALVEGREITVSDLWVDHDVSAWNTVLGASVEWAGSIDERIVEGTTYYKQPSYTVVNAYAECTPQAYEKVAVRLSVDNLFDKNYYERSGFGANDGRGGIEPVWAPGRTVTLGATMKF